MEAVAGRKQPDLWTCTTWSGKQLHDLDHAELCCAHVWPGIAHRLAKANTLHISQKNSNTLSLEKMHIHRQVSGRSCLLSFAVPPLSSARFAVCLPSFVCRWLVRQIIRAAQTPCRPARHYRCRGPATCCSAGTATRGTPRGCTSACTRRSCAHPTAAPGEGSRNADVVIMLWARQSHRHSEEHRVDAALLRDCECVGCCHESCGSRKQLTVAFQVSSTGQPAAATASAAAVLYGPPCVVSQSPCMMWSTQSADQHAAWNLCFLRATV